MYVKTVKGGGDGEAEAEKKEESFTCVFHVIWIIKLSIYIKFVLLSVCNLFKWEEHLQYFNFGGWLLKHFKRDV